MVKGFSKAVSSQKKTTDLLTEMNILNTWGGDKKVYERDCIRVAARIPC
jgi:hypothetical protein